MGTVADQVDPAFIQDPEHRPKLATIEAADYGGEDAGVPLIDLSPIIIGGDDPKSAAVVGEIGRACEEWGFFQVINHGVAAEKRRRAEAAAREFFAMAAEEKGKVRRDERSVLGYYDTELTKNVRDWKEVFDFLQEEPTIVPASPDPDDAEVVQWYNRWPENLPELRYVT